MLIYLILFFFWVPKTLLDRHYKNIIIIIELIWPFLCREAKGGVISLVNLRGQEDSPLGLFASLTMFLLLHPCLSVGSALLS